MTKEEIQGGSKTLVELKAVARHLGIKGWANVKTKDTMIEKIVSEMDELSVDFVTDSVVPIEPVIESSVPIEPSKTFGKNKIRITSFPRKKVKISARDPKITDYPFSVNEYDCLIQMEKEVSLPTPVIEHIELMTELSFSVNPETGFGEHKEVPKFFVRYV